MRGSSAGAGALRERAGLSDCDFVAREGRAPVAPDFVAEPAALPFLSAFLVAEPCAAAPSFGAERCALDVFDGAFRGARDAAERGARRLVVGDSVSACPRVVYQRPTPRANVTRKVTRIHGKSLAIGRSTLKIRLLSPDASSALRPYRVITPTPNAISGGWATAVNKARLRTARTARTHPTR